MKRKTHFFILVIMVIFAVSRPVNAFISKDARQKAREALGVKEQNQTSFTDEQIADAIYKAEGGRKAKVPYGILSVKARGKAKTRKICLETIRNNRTRYADYGYKKYDSFLEFLASRYAPIGASNDPRGLNRHWLKNVKYFLQQKISEGMLLSSA